MSSHSALPVDKKKHSSTKDWLRLICCGLCMGTADIIPGISGGTIAFIMGFYEELLNSIKSLNGLAVKKLCQGSFKEFFQIISWKFLVGLITGIVIAMVSLAHLVTFILNHEQYRVLLYAAFFGLIIGASLLCSKQLQQWSRSHVLAFCVTAAIAFFLTGSISFPNSSNDLFDVKLENVSFDKPLRNYEPTTQMLQRVPSSTLAAMLAKGTIHSKTHVYSYKLGTFDTVDSFTQPVSSAKLDLWIILCGAIAITAMILPGISGSYLLTVLGMYATVIAALADFAAGLFKGHFDTSSFMILTNMLIGIFFGAILFTRFVSWILNKYHDFSIAALTGFMVGALRSVWPFWTYQYALLPLNLNKGPQLETIEPFFPSLASTETWLAISLAIGGAAIVFILHYVAQLQSREKPATV